MHRRSIVAVLTTVIVLLALPAVAAAVPGHRAARAAAPAAARPAPVARAFAPRLLSDPLGVLTGTATIKVHVYRQDGNPQVGAEVAWGVFTDTDGASGSGPTDADGLAQFTGVPAASSNNGEITITPAAGDLYYDIWNLSWPDAGFDAGYQPGAIQMDLLAGGYFNDHFSAYPEAYFQTFSQNGDAYQEADSSQAHPATATLMQAEPQVLNGTVLGGAVQFWYDEGTEPPIGGTAVTPGSTVDSGLTIDEATAQRMFNFTWASGKPGTKTTIRFQNFPAGWVNALSGVSESPSSPAFKDYGTWTMPGGTGWVARSFTIPTSARAGYPYDIYAEHTDGPLTMFEPFQVCTLVPSKATVKAGTSIRFSGRVPFNFYAASPKAKTVILYRRSTRAGQPAGKGGAAVKGWTKVRTFKTGTTGKYRSPLVPITRTGWYALWYPRDNYNWAAWTSVVKVTARR